MKIELRDYQQEAFDRVREALRQGHRHILIVLPTGGGKSVIASALMAMTVAKGNRATFVVDRISLLSQISEMFDRYGIAHGVVQSQHPRFRLYEPVQVCSVQTLAKRGWPSSDVDVIDEAHVLHACHKRRIASGEGVIVGLTATPFTRGLAKYFDAVINVTTTRALIDAGWLSPYRIFSCAEPDMAGARVKSTGEWDDHDASDRATKIVGDVVAEYTAHGEGRKFICSAVDTRHVDELARQFRDAGIDVATYTYHDHDNARAATVREFRKPDSSIRGLVTVTAASRGFDVPDVSCIIIARPLRKSLAEHIQLIGRGLRSAEGKQDCLVLDHAGNCIARGMRVLTRRGLVEIQNITTKDEVWDGHEFVRHRGAVCRGRKRVVEYAGLTATTDHRVKSNDVWRAFGDCAKEQAPIVTTGIGRRAVRERDGYFSGACVVRAARPSRGACSVRVRDVWLSFRDFVGQLASGAHARLPSMQSTETVSEVAVRPRTSDAAQMQQQESVWIRKLRRARDSFRVCVAIGVRSLDHARTWCARQTARNGLGPRRQRWELCAWQPAMGFAQAQFLQSTRYEVGTTYARIQAGESFGYVRGRYDQNVYGAGIHGCTNCSAVDTPVEETEREVWDLLDCGPRNCFTCEGLLVHNCARFFEACETFFDEGQSELDDGTKRERKAPQKTEREPIKCPHCRCLHMPAPQCPACGHQYPRKQAIQHVDGTLFELDGGRRNRSDTWSEKARWMRGLRGYAVEHGYSHGWAAHKYREKYGVWPNDPRVRDAGAITPDPDVARWARSRMIAWAKARKTA